MKNNHSWQTLLPELFPQIPTQTLEKSQQHLLNDNYIVILLAGNAFLYAYSPEAPEPVIVDYLAAGQWIINSAAALYLTLHARNNCRYISLNTTQITQLVHQSETFANELLSRIQIQYKTILQRLCWSQLCACDRLNALLNYLFEQHELIDLKHAELGMMINISRETVSRSLYLLEKQGIIEVNNRKIKRTSVLVQRLDPVVA